MITLQMMKGTGPYNQMQRYIADVHKDLTPQQRAGKFTALLKKYVNNQNAQCPNKNVVPDTLMVSFAWGRSPEGGKFWDNIDRKYSPQPNKKQPKVKPPVKAQPAVAEQPKPAAPALVWPKGFYICVQIEHEPFVRFINEEGQCVNGRFSKWAAPQNFHRWQQKWPTYKRPETPLPNGLQWEEDYTHYNPIVGGFQFNLTHLQQPALGLKKEAWLENGQVQHWMNHENTIQRYPDNQPLILDVPPQPPVRPVEAHNPPEVGQPIQAENVAAKAPVEPPKAMPEVKKPIGWWK